MANSFFFYDLETTGTNPKKDRIMQFAGQRITLELKPIGEPVNIVVRLTPDVVPSPDAILVTGITPQHTLEQGVSEAEFLAQLHTKVCVPETIFIGFNTVRFDDEFMRYTLWRNFYDPYEWQWKDSCSRWDLLDIVRMTRALRPEGIKWPVDDEGKPTNRLELLTASNGISHENAHDALADVHASIAIAKLLKAKQPKLFDYLFEMRTKQKVSELAHAGQPFIYTSGKYAKEFLKTTVAVHVADHPNRQASFVYDLRYDPTPYKNCTPKQLAELWRYKADSTEPRLPVKTLRYNCCPAVAPLGVLDKASQKRLQIDMAVITKNYKVLQSMPEWKEVLLQASELHEQDIKKQYQQPSQPVDARLYDGFIDDHDKRLEQTFREATPESFHDISQTFHDTRLQQLAPLYKARNYPESLTDEERTAWEKYRFETLLGGGEQSQLASYFKRLEQLASDPTVMAEKQFLLEELQLYGQSILPAYEGYSDT